MGSYKTLLLVALAMLACDVSAQISFGSVQLINAVGAKVLVPLCTVPDGARSGPFSINSPGSQHFQFQANSWSIGWRCKFLYVNTAEGNRKYTADVPVWQGLYGHGIDDAAPDSSSLVFTVPCMDCIWKIQRDGFYRADDTNHKNFRLQARWV